MTNKAYIVANEQQEREVLDKLYRDGMTWFGGKEATQIMPSKRYNVIFPYAIFVYYNTVYWNILSELEDEEIVYDGRKEEQMSEKYVVSQEFMNELKEWKVGLNINGQYYIDYEDIYDLSSVIENWWRGDTHALEQNNRLIAIIRWVNGEDVFEIEKPKKWVVRSKEKDGDGEYWYVSVDHVSPDFYVSEDVGILEYATKFDTKEEAEGWANSHQEVVEVNE